MLEKINRLKIKVWIGINLIIIPVITLGDLMDYLCE
jgi:hypothetical protein